MRPSYESLQAESDDSKHTLLDAQHGTPLWRRPTPVLSSVCALFGSFSLGVILSASVAVLLFTSGHFQTRQTFAHSIAHPEPDIPYETRTWDADPLYEGRPTDDNDLAWNMLLPPGRGFVFVDDPDKFNMPPGQDTQWGPIYSVSMYHQIHCLAQLRKAHWTLLDAVTTGDAGAARDYASRGGYHHIQHCVDYLRQAIFCAGDMTLEWPKLDGVGSGIRVDGWKIPHKCKSRAAIQDYMDRYHYNDSMVFDISG